MYYNGIDAVADKFIVGMHYQRKLQTWSNGSTDIDINGLMDLSQ
jgi:hypothetical protein